MENCKYYTKRLKNIAALIGVLYDIEGCACGGLLHIVVDDGNVDDTTIKWTLDLCEKHPEEEEAELGKLICNELLKLSIQQRKLLMYWWLPHPKCCSDGDCEYCPIHEEES